MKNQLFYVVCSECNVSYRIPPSRKKGKNFCSCKCKSEYQKGVPLSVETRAKLSLSHKGKPFSGTHCEWKGRKHKVESRLKMSESHKGEKSILWRGGLTQKNLLLRQGVEYKLWREKVFERDNYTCVLCKIPSQKGNRKEINADHIKPWAYFPELRFDLENGRTLCVDCHKQTDTYMGRAQKNYNPRTVIQIV